MKSFLDLKQFDRYWILFYWTYLLGVSFLVQFFLLPHFFPQWHGGHGLLKGTDSLVFHTIAEMQAKKVMIEGWTSWKLYPYGQVTAGLASVFYRLIRPEPWVMIPLYTLLFSLAAFLLGRIYITLENPAQSWLLQLSIIPFLGFPSAILLYAQLLKDVFFIFGNILFLFGWMKWIKIGETTKEIRWHDALILYLSTLGGYGLAWLVRAYWGPVLVLMSISSFMVIFIRELVRYKRNGPLMRSRLRYLLLTVGITIIMVTANQKMKIPESLTSIPQEKNNQEVKLAWKTTPWLPQVVDRYLERLAFSRKAFVVKYPQAGSTVDKEHIFYEAKDIFCYLPRAFYVGFIMPTPSVAAAPGASPAGSFLRRIVGVEMILLYLCYPLVIVGLCRWRKQPEAGIFLFWAVFSIILYTLTSPNLGALHRFRYVFLTALGGAGIYGMLSQKYAQKV